MKSAQETGRLLVLEDCVLDGCVGQKIAGEVMKSGNVVKLKLCNLGNRFIPQGTVQQLYSDYNLDVCGVLEAAKELCHG